MSMAQQDTPAQVHDVHPPLHREFNIERIRADFPALHQEVHGQPLVYLDNAATSQKPQEVIEALSQYYREDNSNVHRGVHHLSQKATFAYERARGKVKNFLKAKSEKEIIFTRGVTEAINLVACSYGRKHVREGDEVLITHMEHHSNIVPWQLLCEETGATLRVAPINDDGELIFDEFVHLLTERTRIASIIHVSNALGTINPVADMIQKAHEAGAVVFLDGAQSVPHLPVDVQTLDCDFFGFSGHKVFGPTGIGVLYGKRELLEEMPPWQGGGDMIDRVTFEETTFNVLPYKFEAGTPHIAGAIGLGTAIDYLGRFRFEDIERHERDLLDYGTGLLESMPEVRLIGTAREKAGVLSFVVDLPGVSSLDFGTVLDMEGIATRVGHHCAQPVMQRFGINSTTRASLAFYNSREDLDLLAAGMRKALGMFR